MLSMCAGDGRDVLEVLAGRPEDTTLLDVVLVELDPRLAARATALTLDTGLDRVVVRVADAGTTDSYVDATPADLVLACGIFGNVSNDDVQRTVAMLPGLCAEEALVVWTRGRGGTDLTPHIRGWFAEHGFAEREWHAPDDAGYSVGVHQLVGAPTPLEPGRRLFTFLR